MRVAAYALIVLCQLSDPVFAFTQFSGGKKIVASRSTELHVSIGLGPEKDTEDQVKNLVAGVDYEIPDHESFRTSRRSKLDEQCDKWFGSLMGEENGILGTLASDARTTLSTPVPLVNEVRKFLCCQSCYCVAFCC